MRFEIFLAIRYLRTPRRHALAQFTALAAIIGIACGTAAIIFAQALAGGFRIAMQNKILENTAHISVFSADAGNISDWQNLKQQIAQFENVQTVSATSFDNALLIGKDNSSYAVLRGIQSPESKAQSPKLDDRQSTVHNSQITIEIGKDLAEKTGLQTSDEAEIISGSGKMGESFAPVSTKITIGGIFSTGLYEYDSTWIRVDLDTAAKLTGKTNAAATALEIKTNDLYNSNQTARLIRENLGANYKILDWQEANRPLFAALNLERRVTILIISLIVFIAALNVATTVALVVNERKSDIAVLKSCGARGRSIVAIFLLEAIMLGTIGILFGTLSGLAACVASNYFNLITLQPDVYSISEVSLEPAVGEILLTTFATFLICLTASAFPAWRAAKVKPMKNLK